MTDNNKNQTYEDEINIWELLVILAKRKKIIVAVTLSFFVFSVIYSLLATPQYKVSAVLTTKEEQNLSINKGSLGNIANMLGANVSGLLSSGSLQTIKQTLNSSDFIFFLNEKYKIIDVLFKKKKSLIKREKLIKTYKNTINVNFNEENNLLNLKIVHNKPVKAYVLMKNLLAGLNEFITKKQFEESKEMVEVLKNKIRNTNDPLLKSELTKLWSNETKKMLYSKINKHNLYRVLESPFIPQKRVKPKRKLIVIISTFLGFFISIFIVFFIEFIQKSKEDPENRRYFNKFMDHLELEKLKSFFRRRNR